MTDGDFAKPDDGLSRSRLAEKQHPAAIRAFQRLSKRPLIGRPGPLDGDRDVRAVPTPTPSGWTILPSPLHWIPIAAALLISAGAALRLIQYGAQRSLWLDEAMLAVNIGGRSFRELLAPLDYEQIAPPLFLWAERTLLLLGGADEWTLRALPVLAGILLPVLTWILARRLLPATWALLAVALVAFSPTLIRFSNEVKPYSMDAAVGAALVLLALDLGRAPERGTHWWRLGAAGVLSIAVSAGAIFVLVAILLALVVAEPMRKRIGWMKRLAPMGSAWALTFVVLYLGVYHRSSSSAYMAAFWESGFIRPFQSDSALRLWNAIHGVLSSLFLGTLSPSRWGTAVGYATGVQAAFAAILIGIGFSMVARRRSLTEALLLAGPIAVPFIASALGLYPVNIRLVLFAVPGLAILLAAGVPRFLAALPGRARGMALLASVGFLLGPALLRDAIEALHPHHRQETRPLVTALAREGEPSEPVYVSAAAIPAWLFYTTDWSAPDRERLRWFAVQAGSSGPAFHSRISRGRPVRKEGFNLVRSDGVRPEIVGIPTGQRHLTPSGGLGLSDRPDPGWAENEARRIRGAAPSAVWVLFVP
ncbi:MAG: glycosyltransferase family 39 protein, partial [Longimicrobiales bacterium]